MKPKELVIEDIGEQSAELRKAMEVIALENGGAITPQAVLDKAKNPSHIFHDYFDWDDTSAAEKYRLVQASGLIRRIKVHVVREDPGTREIVIETTRAFQSRPSMRSDAGGYEPVRAIVEDEIKLSELIKAARTELLAFQKRYKSLFALHDFMYHIDAAVIELEDSLKQSKTA